MKIDCTKLSSLWSWMKIFVSGGKGRKGSVLELQKLLAISRGKFKIAGPNAMKLGKFRFVGVFIIFAILMIQFPFGVRADVRFYKFLQDDLPSADDYSQAQFYSEWCWAACIHMAYKAQGAELSQYRIVDQIKGVVVNAGAQPPEVIEALTQLTRDDNGVLINSVAAPFYSIGNRQFRNRNPAGQVSVLDPSTTSLMIAFLIRHGIPVIAMYHPNGPLSGHCVLITGVSIDSTTDHAVHYQVDDPWPLDENNQPISDGHAIRKELSAESFEGTMEALVIPFVFTPKNVSLMRKTLQDLQDIYSARGDLASLSDLESVGAFQPAIVTYSDVNDIKNKLNVEDAGEQSAGVQNSANLSLDFASCLNKAINASGQDFIAICGDKIWVSSDQTEYQCSLTPLGTNPTNNIVWLTKKRSPSDYVMFDLLDTEDKDASQTKYDELKTEVSDTLGPNWKHDGEQHSDGLNLYLTKYSYQSVIVYVELAATNSDRSNNSVSVIITRAPIPLVN